MKFCILICSLLSLIMACNGKQKNTLKIAVAANMQFAMKELSKSFTDATGIKCDLIIGASGQITAQIKAGAPYDLFVSADMKYPNELFTSGVAVNKPNVYAYGKLVMWSMHPNIKPTFELLKSKQIRHIALANPKTAPYGAATVEALRHYGIYDEVKEKLVFGESISQTNQFIISGSAEVGFTAKSIVLSPEMNGKGNWVAINDSDYTQIAQGVVILKHNDTKTENATKFYNFLFSPTAKKILTQFGYSVN